MLIVSPAEMGRLLSKTSIDVRTAAPAFTDPVEADDEAWRREDKEGSAALKPGSWAFRNGNPVKTDNRKKVTFFMDNQGCSTKLERINTLAG